MLSDLEVAIASVEGQDLEAVSRAKEGWQHAFEEASRIIPWPERLTVEYNPAIWRLARFPVGVRLFSYPWRRIFVFEFATPNSLIPFECFGSCEAKTGVMAHEIAHFIDDQRWSFDLKGLAMESREYATREQRAELLAFAGLPMGIFEANKALIEATMRWMGYDPGEFEEYLKPLAAVETLGRIGMERGDELIGFYKNLEDAGVPVHRMLEEYLSTNAFSLAGLTTAPDLNKSNAYGIKSSRDLALARAWLCRYLKGELDPRSLEETLERLNFKVKADAEIEGYSPLSCIDFKSLDLEVARKNRSAAMKVFHEDAPWRCFCDLKNALEDIDSWLASAD